MAISKFFRRKLSPTSSHQHHYHPVKLNLVKVRGSPGISNSPDPHKTCIKTRLISRTLLLMPFIACAFSVFYQGFTDRSGLDCPEIVVRESIP